MKKFIFILLIILPLAAFSRSRAQGPQFLITWRATSYTPDNYSGKILPTSGSPISVSAELLDGGKPVNLSKQTIYWYLNSGFLQGGTGLQKIHFIAPQNSAGGTLDLRVEMPGYKGGNLLKTIEIPISQPLAVIESPFPDDEFSAPSLELKAAPYFFNIKNSSDLIFSWSVNGQTAPANGPANVLDINVLPGTANGFNVNVGLNIRNPNNVLISGASTLNLIYKP